MLSSLAFLNSVLKLLLILVLLSVHLFVFISPLYEREPQVTFAVDGVLLLASLSIIKALLEVHCFSIDATYCFGTDFWKFY